MTTQTDNDTGSSTQATGGTTVFGTTGQVVVSANTGAITVSTPATSWQYVKVSPSSAAINGMRVTPILAVAAGGANTLLIVQRFAADHKHDGTAYASGGNLAVQYDSTTNNGGVAASSSLDVSTITLTSDRFSQVGISSITAAASSTTVNKGLYISNTVGSFTTGTDTVNFHIWYSTISTTI